MPYIHPGSLGNYMSSIVASCMQLYDFIAKNQKMPNSSYSHSMVAGGLLEMS